MSHKEELAQDIRNLVKQLTGFEDDDDNLRRCESYALSNILNHRCVSVEGQKVRNAMDGIVTKFFVHGHLQASKRLSELFEKFLTDKKFEDPSHCDEKWSALWLLLCLANRPTSNLQPNETPKPVNEKRDDENFDWGAYLMDGVAPFSRPYKDDSDESFSELDDSGVSSVSEVLTHTSTPSVEQKSAELECTSRNEELVELVNKGVEAERWLKRNVQNCWWITGDVPNEVHSKYPCANFAERWEEYSMAEKNDGHCCRPRTIKISEYKVVREVLFMLHSPSATFLFHQENGRFVVRDNVTIPSLTKDAMKNYLEHVCEYVNIVYELQKFKEEVYAGYQMDSSSTTRPPTFTFEVYAASLHDILLEFAQFISKIEGRVRKQEDINTLYQLICELKPKFKELKVVYDTHVLATEDWRESSNWLAVTRLLSVLYEAGISATEGYESRHILTLFLKSFRPYFDIISTWLTEGQLEDWRQEFIITRIENVIDRTWDMWEEGFTLHPYKNCLKSKGVEPLPLLEDVAEKVLHAGKSIELLKKLNKSGDFTHLSDTKGSLYKEFLIAVIKELPVHEKQKHKNVDNESTCNGEHGQEQITNNENTIEAHTAVAPVHKSVTDISTAPERGLNLSEERPLHDFPMLRKIVKNLFSMEDKQLEWQDIAQMEEQKLFDKVIQKLSSGCFPVKPLLESVFTYFIYEKHGTACSLVKNMLHSEYNIAVQLSVVRNIYLMEGSDMEKFCSHVFNEVEKNYAWDNAYSLTMQLENCIDEQYPSLSSKFSVSVSKRSQTIISVDTLDSIKIEFSVECPMTLIFTKANMKMYNSVFRFLLKVKWALWALEQLRFKRGEMKINITAESASNIRKRNILWLLRFWMLHSIGCLHSYLMGQVLVSLGLELERDIEEAADLDTLIRVHNNYIQKVYTHCLQPKEYENIRRAVLQLVTLSLKLREVWLVALEIVSEERLGKMADLYIKCHSQLGVVLQNAVDASHDPLYKCVATMRTQPLVYHLPCHMASPDELIAQLFPSIESITRKTVKEFERFPQSDTEDVLVKFLRNMLLSYKQTKSSAIHIDEDSFVFHNFIAAFNFSVEQRRYFPGFYDSQCAEILHFSRPKKIGSHKNMHRCSQEKKFYNTRNYKHSKITKRRLYLRSEHSLLMKFQNCLRISQHRFKSEIVTQRQKLISLPSLKKRIKLSSTSDLAQTKTFFSKSDSIVTNIHEVKEISTQTSKIDIANDDTCEVYSSETTEEGTYEPTSDEFLTGTNHSTKTISYTSGSTTEIDEEDAISSGSNKTLNNLQSAVKLGGNSPEFGHDEKSCNKTSLKKGNCEALSQIVRPNLHEAHSSNKEIWNSQSTPISTNSEIPLPQLIKSEEAYIKISGNDEAGYDADCDTVDSESENSNSDLEDCLDLLLFNSKTDVSGKSRSTQSGKSRSTQSGKSRSIQYTSASESITDVDSKPCSSYFSIINDKSHSELCLVTHAVSECASEHKIQRCNSGNMLNIMSHKRVFAKTDITPKHLRGSDHKVFNRDDTMDVEKQSTKSCLSINTSSDYVTGVESRSHNSQGSVINAITLPKLYISGHTNSEYSCESVGSEINASSYIEMFPPVNLAGRCSLRENDQPKDKHFTVLHDNKKFLQDSLSEVEITEYISKQSTKAKKLLEKQSTSIATQQISTSYGPLCRTCVFKCGLLPTNVNSVRGKEILQHLLETDKKLKKQENKQCIPQMDKKSKFCSKCRILFTKNA